MASRDSLLAGFREAAQRARQTLTTFAGERLQDAESLLLMVLRHREASRDSSHPPSDGPRDWPPPAAPPERPGALLQSLLSRSAEQTVEESRTTLFVAMLRDLVPDEARILAALSDGTPYPLLHLDAGPRLGGPTRRVLANRSNVGRAAGVGWIEMTPIYVGRLLRLGLADTGPEDETFQVQYEIMAAEDLVRAAVERIRKQDRQRESLVRRVLTLSALGRALWTECETGEEPPR